MAERDVAEDIRHSPVRSHRRDMRIFYTRVINRHIYHWVTWAMFPPLLGSI